MAQGVFGAVWLAGIALGSALIGQEPAPAVAFIRGGDVWVHDVAGGQSLRLASDR